MALKLCNLSVPFFFKSKICKFRFTHHTEISSYLKCFRHKSTNHGISLSGIFPPITTPFDADEQICYKNLKSNLEKWEKIPFRGFVVLGSTGEVVLLSSKERVEIVKFVKKMASPKKLILAGSGCESTKHTIELTQEMASVGADAALVVNPSFYKGRMTDEALYAHYSKVSDASPIPIVLYNVPANTGIELTSSVIVKLSDHPNIIGLKDSGGDITKIAHIVHQVKDKDFQVVAGSAGFLYSALCVGCVGGILALANPLGQALCDLHRLFYEKEYKQAQLLQHRVIGPNLSVTKRFGIPGVKKALELFGYYGGPLRSPLQPLAPNEIEALTNEFKSNGFLP